jgi:RsmE family RNA methyltransferase
MNLVLLDNEASEVVLPRSDPRADHILTVLRRREGEMLDVGLEDGRIGKGKVRHVSEEGVTLTVEWTGLAPHLHPITLILGMPRPQTGRRLLREMTGLGVRRLIVCGTDRSDPGYARSRLWTSGEWQRHLRSGAEQAFNPRVPDLMIHVDLTAALDDVGGGCERIAMDNYESPASLSTWKPHESCLCLAIGAERGWSAQERLLLRNRGFRFYHLGTRVLRMDTAAIACVAIALSRMGLA